LNRRILIISAGLILTVLVAHALLWRGTQQQEQNREALQTEIAPLRAAMEEQEEALPILATRQAELEALQTQLQVADISLPSEVDSTAVLAEIVAQAAIHEVKLNEIQAETPLTHTVEGIDYRILTYNVTAQGELAAVAGFLNALETGPIAGIALRDVGIEYHPAPATETPQPTPFYRGQVDVQITTRLLSAEQNATLAAPLSSEERAQQLEVLVEEAKEEAAWERAVDLLIVLRQLRPQESVLQDELITAYVRAGQQLLAQEQYEQATQYLQAALTLDPDQSEAQEALALLTALTPTATPTVTPTPEPTATGTPTLTPTPSLTPMPYYVANLQRTANDRYPTLGCNWFGFYGKITDVNGYPVPGVNVHLWAQEWSGITTTSSSSGEYELYLDDNPRKETWFIQLYAGGAPISNPIEVETYDDCGSSLVRMDWKRGY
jgi:tetratricopeptide (TPR) repeat protein